MFGRIDGFLLAHERSDCGNSGETEISWQNLFMPNAVTATDCVCIKTSEVLIAF